MQAKGLIKFFFAAILLVCLYYLSFTWFTNIVEGRAKEYAEEKIANKTFANEFAKEDEIRKESKRYLDSVANKKVINLGIANYTYNEVQERQLSLGLDLQGGMSVVLEVRLEDLITSLANNSKDPTFAKAIARAKELEKGQEADFVTLFGAAWKEVAPDVPMANIFNNAKLRDKNISANSTNDQILAVIRDEGNAAVDRTFQIMRTRVDQFGVSSANINLQKSTGRIYIELPGVDDRERVRKLLQASAKLEFWEVYENSNEIAKMIQAANKALAAKYKIKTEDNASAQQDTIKTPDANNTETANAGADTTKAKKEGEVDLLADKDTSKTNADSLDIEKFKRENPLLGIFSPIQQAGAPMIGYVSALDIDTLRAYFNMPEVKQAFPANIKLVISAKPSEASKDAAIHEVYAVQSRFGAEQRAAMEGDVVTDARQDVNQKQQTVVTMAMNSEGAKMWRKITGENIGQSVAVVLDDLVYSAPTVQNEIAGGNTEISGNFTVREAQDLASILKAGKLPAPAKIIQEEVIGPSLGEKSITAGILSLVLGFAAILLFMVLYYRTGGLIANLALLINLFIIIGVLASLGSSLTLPGMAGIILTMGIAVDANILIFERIREELARGLSLAQAVAHGYSKSYSAIIDANITTLITATILVYFGLGPIRGFATVLIIGLFSSLFTAIFITRLMIEWLMKKGVKISYASSWSLGMFKNIKYDFIGIRRIPFALSFVAVIIGLVSFFTKGFEMGVDLKGGRTYVVKFDQTANASDIRDAIAAKLGSTPIVQTFGSSNQVKITTSHLIDNNDPEVDKKVISDIHEVLVKFGAKPDFNAFSKENLQSSQKVGANIADDIKRGAVWATMLALLSIFAYITMRFPNWRYGLGAVLATSHDGVVILALFSIFAGILPFSLEIDQTFIAAFLTIIGYSVNDTVVIFDRVREYIRNNPKRDLKETMNDAIASTLSRTINVSLSMLLVVLCLFIFGGDVIRGFAFAMIVGIIVGTYSSIFIASSVVYEFAKGRFNPEGLAAKNTEAKEIATT
ncbi:MAG: protein translocase subunit SecDF [Sphingobacteriales bacterium]|nr:protein translocase subunit SecDF [Sphingobacteriales bacterium]MBP9140060.1 protein translocase subunit SecDF [Chitinophagales bacterium]MDA0197858.1 protein translocase subunit SecDF [Bacteroidota bacterium]MBK6889921.1 protein translocase subunit SecDF [Sphingobacteriales bacterium]MBK7527555.1 protein translocase subunit SecDF [Sphingobacteriales bacterium]